MNRIVLFSFIAGIALLYAHDAPPASLDAHDGKVIYAPIPKPINLYEEKNIQKEDHNNTGHGKAKE